MNRLPRQLIGLPKNFLVPRHRTAAIKNNQPAFATAKGLHIDGDLLTAFFRSVALTPDFQLNGVAVSVK